MRVSGPMPSTVHPEQAAEVWPLGVRAGLPGPLSRTWMVPGSHKATNSILLKRVLG